MVVSDAAAATSSSSVREDFELDPLRNEGPAGGPPPPGGGGRQHWLELRIPPVALVALCVAAMIAAARFLPGAGFALPGRGLVAIALALPGGLFGIAGVLAFRAARTTVDPRTPGAASSLVHAGIYRWSRNPMYVGLALVLAALAVYLANAVSAAVVPGFIVYMNRYQIAAEERALLARFGSEYARYCAQVRRWI